MKQPYIIHFAQHGDTDIGYISVAETLGTMPFEVKRIFWTYATPESIVRGRHAHHTTEQVLVAVAGRIVVLTELPTGELQTFVLDQPNLGLYIPPTCWHTMQYSQSAVQVVLASTNYNEEDYISSYNDFRALYRTSHNNS